jgi:hypothetical protein
MRNILFSLTVVLLSACSTTKQLDHWQSEAFSRNDFDNVLIIGAATNRGHRFIFESELERRMTDGGLTNVKALDVLGDKVPDRETVEAYVAKNDIDYIIATRLETVNTDTTYVPPSAVTYITGPYYPSYNDFYGSSITLVTEARQYDRSTMILLTMIYDAKTSEPVWVGRSSTFEPGSMGILAGEIARSTWLNISR